MTHTILRGIILTNSDLSIAFDIARARTNYFSNFPKKLPAINSNAFEFQAIKKV